MTSTSYLLAGRASELARLERQSQVWEPSGRRLLAAIGAGAGGRALEVGCGVLGWLRLLSDWVGPGGAVVGTDVDDAMLAAARKVVTDQGLANVTLVEDDLFASTLDPASFDLVHARFEITPLGRGPEQMATYLRLCRPGGWVVLEDPGWGSWQFNPPAPALDKLIVLIQEAFRHWGDAEAGRKHPELLRSFGIEPHVRAEVLALPAGDPYLHLPLQLATGLAPRLGELVDAGELEQLQQQGESELEDAARWGTTFTLLQCWGRTPA